jgi:ribonuclease HI
MFYRNTNTITSSAEIYTDGSCHTQHRTGAWVTILLVGPKKIVLSGCEGDTTHNRMELMAVIRGMEYIKIHYPAINILHIYSDSQYVVRLPGREDKLTTVGFANKKGVLLPNTDLLKELPELSLLFTIEWVKVKAHQKKGVEMNYNIDADFLSRKLVREAVKRQI